MNTALNEIKNLYLIFCLISLMHLLHSTTYRKAEKSDKNLISLNLAYLQSQRYLQSLYNRTLFEIVNSAEHYIQNLILQIAAAAEVAVSN